MFLLLRYLQYTLNLHSLSFFCLLWIQMKVISDLDCHNFSALIYFCYSTFDFRMPVTSFAIANNEISTKTVTFC